MTSLNALATLLRQTMGLDVTSIGVPALKRAVQERQRACGVEDARAYLDRVRASEAELQALIEAVVISETWFFRDQGAFAALVRFVQEEWLPGDPEGCLRLLSMPCSTGEEPYSMAMALVDAGLPPGRFRIEAIDICGRSLKHARRGVYGKSAFRGDAVSFRERHFERLGSGHKLSDTIRALVDFQQANLFGSNFLPVARVYDVIFCRNMLIYFDRETQDRAVSVLGRLLTPRGLLFVGSSESGVFLNHAFSSARAPMAFAFRNGCTTSRPQGPTIVAKSRRTRAPRAGADPNAARHRPAGIRKRDLPASSSADPNPEPDPGVPAVEDAMRLADQGRFAEASQWCEDYLQQHGPSAEVFHVLGLMRDALGNASEAATYYRKALYLDPGHQDVLLHLALLMEKRGQKSEAQVLWNRVRRLAPHTAQ